MIAFPDGGNIPGSPTLCKMRWPSCKELLIKVNAETIHVGRATFGLFIGVKVTLWPRRYVNHLLTAWQPPAGLLWCITDYCTHTESLRSTNSLSVFTALQWLYDFLLAHKNKKGKWCLVQFLYRRSQLQLYLRSVHLWLPVCSPRQQLQSSPLIVHPGALTH